ncbi:tetratricopeptide repeat protein [Catenulispora sp. NF23]|uniref:tetratricopeptide repeat protein n=1 Tax=Catenulispora pinistramenti TaxID=2705254 RepID=UPI001BA78788|nr:tetratricopeptide repeat protein [Catenulispora pinistramenti]MBS2539725.1 tetratricopeptide repeat protein [Catenulispora pinistramenti]
MGTTGSTADTAEQLLADGTDALMDASFSLGDFDDAQAKLEAARARAVADGDRRSEALALDKLAMVLHYRALENNRDTSNADAEEALFRQALATQREIGDLAGVAESLFGIGLVHQVLHGDWATAMPYYREALELADQHADAYVRSECYRHLGFYYFAEEHDADTALKNLHTSQRLREEWGDPRSIASGTLTIGQLHLLAGRHAEAARDLRTALEQMEQAGVGGRRAEQGAEWLRRAEAGEPAPAI